MAPRTNNLHCQRLRYKNGDAWICLKCFKSMLCDCIALEMYAQYGDYLLLLVKCRFVSISKRCEYANAIDFKMVH